MEEPPRMGTTSIDFDQLAKVEGLAGPLDLRAERYREYVKLSTLEVYRIDRPIALYYRDGGSTHRVVDARGMVHCVPFGHDAGFILRWKALEGFDPVSF